MVAVSIFCMLSVAGLFISYAVFQRIKDRYEARHRERRGFEVIDPADKDKR